MYKESPLFNPPSDDAVLWRYMSFTKFVSLLAKGALFFVRADRLDDRFEGTLGSVNLSSRESVYGKSEPAAQPLQLHHVFQIFESVRKLLLVNCWHENEQESDAMWKLYSGIEDGVAIKTDFKSLSKSLIGDDAVNIGRVNYVDYETTWIPEGNMFGPIQFKRKGFEHEREVRAVICEDPQRDAQGYAVFRESAGAYHKVDVSVLIKEVVLPPLSQPWFEEVVRMTAERYDLTAPVRSSLLGTHSAWDLLRRFKGNP